jgi:hypothetical protein
MLCSVVAKVRESWRALVVLVVCASMFPAAVAATDPAATIASEAEFREAVKIRVAELWEAEDFDKLDALGARYLAEETRSRSGIWALGIYSSALVEQVNSSIEDPRWWDFMAARAKKWVETKPKSAFAHLQVANTFVQRAWHGRGTGYASTVSKDGWTKFDAYIEGARTQMQSSKSIAAKDPNWYVLMLQIATWQRWPEEKVRALLKEATLRHKHYFPIYFAAIDYFSPKWGGSPERVEEIAGAISQGFLGDDAAEMYVRMYWWIADNHFKGQILDTKVRCAELTKGIRVLVERYPDPWNVNRMAGLACDCADKPLARSLFERIGDKPILSAWGGSAKTFARVKAWAFEK